MQYFKMLIAALLTNQLHTHEKNDFAERSKILGYKSEK